MPKTVDGIVFLPKISATKMGLDQDVIRGVVKKASGPAARTKASGPALRARLKPLMH